MKPSGDFHSSSHRDIGAFEKGTDVSMPLPRKRSTYLANTTAVDDLFHSYHFPAQGRDS
jgi:hypothetical protein